ncbi:MAG TPA: PHB depolymerase family esterase [Acidimicrobiales bacterium]|nr:PHB depolymerase family esterase [Acidimicrobiales bacterium]
MKRLLGILLTVGLLVAAPAARGGEKPGSFTRHTSSTKDSYGPRTYRLYVPKKPSAAPRPLVVYLHGCTQTGEDAATGTRWNVLAEKRNFDVVYPEQRVEANGTQCWNWFLPDHQSRDAGEPAIIASIVRDVTRRESVDPTRVYVLGASAGADMATIMAATYPDLFAAGGGFGGCAYLTCADVTGKATNTAMGSRARVMPFFVVQGSIDLLNNVAMGETLVRNWVGANDIADGGVDGSVSPAPSSSENRGFEVPGNIGTVGDHCVRSKQFPCAGALVGAKSYPYTVDRYAGARGCPVVQSWVIHGLGHDYPGGDPRGSFTDPIGPDVTAGAWDYFDLHRLGAPCKNR